jgi:outer membrane protein assembly factor BamA
MKAQRIKKNLLLLGILFFQYGFASSKIPSLYLQKKVGDTIVTPIVDTPFNIVISSVRIVGNKKTNKAIILRELPFKEGQQLYVTVKEMSDILTNARQLIYNTNLFSAVSVGLISNDSTQIVLLITVTERLFFYPVPQFRLIDRNFNEWWKTFDRDPERTIYGLRIFHNNVSGNADRLSIGVMNGYLKSISLGYGIPYINKKQTIGISASAFYAENREFTYASSNNNKLLLYRTPSFERKQFVVSGGLTLRKGLFTKQLFQLHYSNIVLPDSFALKNPGYLNTTEKKIAFADVNYTFQYIKVDNINYPQRGKIFVASLFNRGLGLSSKVAMTSFDFTLKQYMQHKRINFALQVFAKCKLPFKQPYFNQRMLGYNDLYLRGLEYYVVDGVVAGLSKFTVSTKILQTNVPLPFRVKNISRIPLSIFMKTYGDLGYVQPAANYYSNLNNRLLYSGGLGFDLLSLYDMQLGIEYSINQLGERGLFLHTRAFF